MDDGLRSQNVGFLMMHGIAVIIENLPARAAAVDERIGRLEKEASRGPALRRGRNFISAQR